MHVDNRRFQRLPGKPSLLAGDPGLMRVITQVKAPGAVAKALPPCALLQLVTLGYVEIKNERAVATQAGIRWFNRQDQ